MDGIDGIIAAYWELDFSQFCNLVGIPADTGNAKSNEAWDEFQALYKAIENIDADHLLRLSQYRRGMVKT